MTPEYFWPQTAKPETIEAPAYGNAFPVASIFYSVQGEGSMVGTPMMFLRFAGCNLACAGCDTNTVCWEMLTLETILEKIRTHRPNTQWVCLTGGEPTQYQLAVLIKRLGRERFFVTMETNGEKKIPGDWALDHVTVSPKTLDFVQRTGHDMKVVMVPGLYENDAALQEIMESSDFSRYFVQPFYGSPESLKQALAFVERNPLWRLSLQTHKLISIL